MGDSIKKTIDIAIATSYNGAGVKLAAADLQKIREQAQLPEMGPLTRGQAATENAAIEQHVVDTLIQQRVQRMEAAATTARIRQRVDEALFGDGGGGGGGGPRFGPSEQRARDLEATRLRIERSGLASRDYGYDVSRLRGGLTPAGSIAKAQEDLFKSLNEQKEKLERMLKLGGAVGIADLIGKALQRIPEVVDKFHDDVKAGATKSEAFGTALADALPGIGDLAKGFKGLYTVLDAGESERLRKQRAAEDQQDQRDERQRQLAAGAARKDPIRQAGKDTYIDAIDRLRVAGSRGDVRSLAELDVARDQANRKLDELLAKKGNFGNPEEQAKLAAQVAKGRQAADAEYEEKRAEIFRQADIRMEAERRAHVDRLRDIDDAAIQADLEIQGRYFDLKLRGIAEEEEKEREAAKRAYEDALKDPNTDPQKAAERRAETEIAARVRANEKIRAANEQDRREREDEERAHQQKLLDTDADFAERRLKLAGKGNEAERLELQKQHADRLEEIRAQAEQELRAHAERAPEILKRAQEDVDRANEQYRLGLDEMDARNRSLFRPDQLGAVSGESRLLSGVSGAAGENSVGTHIQTIAAAAKKAEEVRQRMNDNVQTIADWIRAQTAAPAAQPVPR